ncbi:hypothetical protein M3J09_009706 [Ascochyta lentis]
MTLPKLVQTLGFYHPQSTMKDVSQRMIAVMYQNTRYGL